MFKHPGRQVKLLAVLILVLYIFAGFMFGTIIGGIINSASAAAREYGVYTQTVTDPTGYMYPLIGTIVGLIIGGVNAIILYAFGALVDDTETQRAQLMGLCADVAALRLDLEGRSGRGV